MTMPERFDDVIRDALSAGREARHEAQTADFGPPLDRAVMFRNCLEAVVKRYPDIRLKIVASRTTLLELALIPRNPMRTGGASIAVSDDISVPAGIVRLIFAPPATKA
jgi:hypothetical protein